MHLNIPTRTEVFTQYSLNPLYWLIEKKKNNTKLFCICINMYNNIVYANIILDNNQPDGRQSKLYLKSKTDQIHKQ